ncbi:MAG: type II restriction endonuclease [Cyclobacteriaceae bacterium]
MKQGFLSQYFIAVTAKKLSAVEVDPNRSHQHEFNGSKELKMVLGSGSGEKALLNTRFIWFGGENEGVVAEGVVTWYDARIAHKTRSEYRLYFPSNEVMDLSQTGDSMFIAKRVDGSLIIIITASNSTVENQLYWLFGIPKQIDFRFSSLDFEENDIEVDFTVRFILDELGIDVEEPETERLDGLLERFKGAFPNTKEFSAFARDNFDKEVSIIEEPDETLMKWIGFEESLFRRLERHIVSKRLEEGFSDDGNADVDGFITFSLSVQNRRKARAGLSLENHLEQIFDLHKIDYQRGARTENNASPDFLFPGIKEYQNQDFPSASLTMLGVKTSCKDRWRQVLSEADRIPSKHLLTLEPGISRNQTDEMKANNLQLVLPLQIHNTYDELQRRWLIGLSDFIGLVKRRGKLDS